MLIDLLKKNRYRGKRNLLGLLCPQINKDLLGLLCPQINQDLLKLLCPQINKDLMLKEGGRDLINHLWFAHPRAESQEQWLRQTRKGS
ncbi:hypothetical protein DPMN_100260 [Dreissena polymorpha]|uniref:Uncharacterized protein n=1 Tax=Dreissena polymorpha TaxID=45954 RepID=A0A9D4LH17_DREPO|nr:hypothetical protein DPMN_100260 [Dreissena polymorpha]